MSAATPHPTILSQKRALPRLLLMMTALAAFCGQSLSAGEDGPVLPPLQPPAPFARAAAGPEQDFRPEVEGRAVRCGNKRLEIAENGALQLFIDGRAVLTGMSPMLALTRKDNGGKDWISAADLKRARGQSPVYSPADKTFRWQREIPLSGASAVWTCSLSVREDGLLRLEGQWTLPEDKEFRLAPASLAATIPQAMGQNRVVRVNEEARTIPEKPEYDFFTYDRTPLQSITFFPEEAGQNFRLLPEVISSAKLYWDKAGKTGYAFRLYEEPRSGRLVVLLDLRRGSAPAAGGAPEQTQGGIDFAAVEDLTLPDRSACRNLLLNPSFEQDRSGYWADWGRMNNTPDPAIWKEEFFRISGQSPRSGRQCLDLTAPARVAGDYRAIGKPLRTFPVPLTAGVHTFSVYARAEREGQRLSVWFPNAAWVGIGNKHLPIGFEPTGKSKTAQIVFPLTPGWQRYSFRFRVPQSMPVFASLGADSPDGSGRVFLDDLQLEKGEEATEFSQPPVCGRLRTAAPDRFLPAAAEIKAGLEILAPAGTSGRATVTVQNFFREELFRGDFDFAAGAGGKADITLPLEEKLGRGIFVLRCDYTLADGRKTHEMHRLAVMDFLDGTSPARFMFADDYGDAVLERCDARALLERYRRTGTGAINHNRTLLKETHEMLASYGVAAFDTSFASTIRYFVGGDYFTGQKVNALVIGGGPLSPNGLDDPQILLRDFHHDGSTVMDEAYLQKFRTAVATKAARYPWIKTVNLGGELFHYWPYSWWAPDGSPETAMRNYARLLSAFIEGVRQGNPAARVYQGSPTNMSQEGGVREIASTLAAVNAAGSARFDLIGCHTYRKRPESPDLDDDTAALLKTMAEYGYDKTPVFFGEGMHYGPYTIPQWGIESASWLPPSCWYYGTLSYDMGWSEKISAAWRARSWLAALKYRDRVECANSGAFINNFEMDLDLTPFATQKIANTLTRLLGEAAFRADIRFAPYTRCYLFEDAHRRPVAVLWGFHPKLDAGTMTPPEAEIALASQLESVYDLMECRRQTKTAGSEGVRIAVSSFPVFLRGKPGTLEAFRRALQNAALQGGDGILPVMLSARPATPQRVEIHCRNFLSRPFRGELFAGGQSLPLLAEPASSATVPVALPQPLQAGSIAALPLPVKVRDEAGREFSGDLGLRAMLCLPPTREIVIDGDPADWSALPEVAFSNRQTFGKTAAGDFDGWFKTAWTDRGLFLCVRVKDPVFYAERQTEPEQRWNNDSLQIYLDALGDARARQQTGYDENDYEYNVYPGADGKSAEAYRRRSPDPQLTLGVAAPRDKTLAPDIPAAFRRYDGGYVYEVFLPAKYLLPIRLEKGFAFGLGLTCNDRNRKDGKVEGALTLTPAGAKEGCFQNPHLWPVVLLWNE